MRLLVLVLNILVGSSLLAQSTEISAATMDTKTNKNNLQRGHATRLRGKSKHPRLLPVKQKSLRNPGNVWERIRSDMQIPRPSPVQTLPDQALAKNNIISSHQLFRHVSIHVLASILTQLIPQMPVQVKRHLTLQELDRNEHLLSKKPDCR